MPCAFACEKLNGYLNAGGGVLVLVPVVVGGCEPEPEVGVVTGVVTGVVAGTVVVAGVSVADFLSLCVATSTTTTTAITTTTPMIGPHRFSWRLPPDRPLPLPALAGCMDLPPRPRALARR